MRRFSEYTCIDWSGAKTERPNGLAVATIGMDGPPALIAPHQRWSRADILHWLHGLASEKRDMLIGFDLSMALPFFDTGSYFPHWDESPQNARQLWAMVERLSKETAHLGVSDFLAHAEASRHFRHSRDHVGDLFPGGTGRLRVVEHHQRETRQANSASCFNLVGAAQVGKSSLTGMRLLDQLGGAIPVWPFDPVPSAGPVILEIYTAMAARAAGRRAGRSKVRDRAGLQQALTALNVPCPARLVRYDDHSTDALITAAWMRQASTDKRLWSPPTMTAQIAEKEGWTFGVF